MTQTKSNPAANVVYSATLVAVDTTTIAGSTAGILECVVPDGFDSWQAQFGGTFSTGTVIQFESTTYSPPTLMNQWFGIQGRRNGTPAGATTEGIFATGDGTAQAYLGLTSARSKIRFRVSALTASDSINVRVTLSQAAPTGVLLAALPAGTNNIGKVSTLDTAGQSQYNFPAGFVRTTDEPRQTLYDPFDGAALDPQVWTATNGNSAPAAGIGSGNLVLGPGTVANGYSTVSSVPAFRPVVPSWLGFSSLISFSDGAAPIANVYRFWGAATFPAAPTAASPVTNGYGFEMTTAGKLVAVVYSGGVRTQVADFSSSGTNTQPLDANLHRYIIYVRTDRTFWYIDSLATPVASTSGLAAQIPATQTLPATFLAIGGATPPASNAQITCSGTSVWDTGKNATQIADGTYPWRRASVGTMGQLSTMLAPSAGTWTPYAGVGPATIILGATESLINFHAFANNADATVNVGGAVYTVRAGTGFDYAPGKPPAGITLTIAAGIDYFVETSK